MGISNNENYTSYVDSISAVMPDTVYTVDAKIQAAVSNYFNMMQSLSATNSASFL